ncbi:MAG: D-alanyl-D-alanine carboxypeptidase [Rhodanobacteraceae bacterium]|nr:D-alanyl-D-alanine carboxypeptidase [Rhodanobacteraceae bacterium]
MRLRSPASARLCHSFACGRALAVAVLSCAVAARADAAPVDAYPGAAAAYIVVADGRPLWVREPATHRQPASLAKLLAALALLEGGWRGDALIEVGPRAAAIEGSRLGLRAGEALRAEDALTALLVRSANDACVALAEHAAGSLERFAARMNARAARLGMRDSHFVHPCGLDAPGQRSSARDLLRLAAAAMQEPRIARIVAMQAASVTTQGGRRLAMRNGNALLGRVAGVVGIKSGYTRGAGKCVIALAHRGPHSVWLVMLGAPDRWWVASGIIDAAFRELDVRATAGAS